MAAWGARDRRMVGFLSHIEVIDAHFRGRRRRCGRSAVNRLRDRHAFAILESAQMPRYYQDEARSLHSSTMQSDSTERTCTYSSTGPSLSPRRGHLSHPPSQCSSSPTFPPSVHPSVASSCTSLGAPRISARIPSERELLAGRCHRLWSRRVTTVCCSSPLNATFCSYMRCSPADTGKVCIGPIGAPVSGKDRKMLQVIQELDPHLMMNWYVAALHLQWPRVTHCH